MHPNTQPDPLTEIDAICAGIETEARRRARRLIRLGSPRKSQPSREG